MNATRHLFCSAPPERTILYLNLVSINILPLWGKENILFHTNICGDMFNSPPPPPEEVYPAELRGIMLIDKAPRVVGVLQRSTISLVPYKFSLAFSLGILLIFPLQCQTRRVETFITPGETGGSDNVDGGKPRRRRN